MIGDLRAYDACLYMKVGQHAGEPWESIVERKQREIRVAGMSFWGYGGNTAPPNIVLPFVREWVGRLGESIPLVMEVINSKAVPQVQPAAEYSENGEQWLTVPRGIQVLGSKYAFVLRNLTPVESMIDLEVYAECRQGRPAADYIRGRVDKACLVRTGQATGVAHENGIKRISMQAELLEPYAVYLR